MQIGSVILTYNKSKIKKHHQDHNNLNVFTKLNFNIIYVSPNPKWKSEKSWKEVFLFYYYTNSKSLKNDILFQKILFLFGLKKMKYYYWKISIN